MSEVTVVCTARNAAGTIGDTIASIVAQDFADWEMIIVDDGSADDTWHIATAATVDPRIRSLQNKEHGRARALNLALGLARTPLVANIDADDIAHPRRLRAQVDALRCSPHITVLGTATKLLYGSAAAVKEWPIEESTRDYHKTSDVTGALRRTNQIVHSSAMFRRDAILSLGGYDERLPSAIDYDLWVRCAQAGMKLSRLEMALTGKRIHRSQHFASLPKMQRLRTTLEIQRRAGATPIQLAARAAWLLIPQSLRDGLGRAAW